MKKILTYILISIPTLLIISKFAVMQTSFADTINHQPTTLIAENTFKPTIIPTDSGDNHLLLIGPSAEDQTNKGARNLLVNTILPKLAIWLIGFVGGIALLFLIISGVRFAVSYGNDEAIRKAKDQAMYSLIGLVIAILSYTIVMIIINLKFEGNTNPASTTQQGQTRPAQPATP